MHVAFAAVWLPLFVVIVVGSLGLLSVLMRPKLRDPRLDRTFGGKPGKYDNPATRFRR